MKLAYIVSEFPSLSQTFILSQISGLLDDGHDVDIYAARSGSERVRHPDVERHRLLARTRYRRDFAAVNGQPRRLARAMVIVARAALRHPMLVGRWIAVLRRDGAFHALNQLFAVEPFWRKDYDVIVTHFGPTGNAWLFLKELTRAKYACAFYGYDVTSYVREHGPAVYRELFRRGDLFLALSRHMAAQLRALGCDPERMVIHPLGVDTSRFVPRTAVRVPGAPLRVLSVARFVEKKGLADAIEAVGRVVRGGAAVAYTIVGTGPLEEALRGLVRARDLEGSVTLAGPKRNDEVADLMAQADVFLLPSVTASDGDEEGTPTVLLEAQACGVPVLSTRHSGIPEIIADEQSGYLVPEHDVPALAERLQVLADRPDLRKELGAFGRRRAVEWFDAQTLCRRLAGVFGAFAQSGRAAAAANTGPDSPAVPGPDISVILPTRNRAAQACETLRRVAGQDTGGLFTYEVLVVDNGSTDHTRSSVEGLRAEFPVPLRFIREDRAGKSNALNTGIAAAAGGILAMLDDDVEVPSGWLRALWDCFLQESADAVTGRVLPNWTGPRPGTPFDDDVVRHINQAGLGCIDHGNARRRSSDGQDCRWVGGNMAIRREAAQRVGPFHPMLARGQDSEYYGRCVSGGLRVVYEPAALAHHRISPDRLSAAALRQWRYRQGYYEAMLLPWKLSHAITIMPVWRWAATATALGKWLKTQVAGRSRWDRFYAELKVHEQIGGWAYRLQHWPGRRGNG